jgi:hypothetical protein
MTRNNPTSVFEKKDLAKAIEKSYPKVDVDNLSERKIFQKKLLKNF